MNITKNLFEYWQQRQFARAELEVEKRNRRLFSMSGRGDINLLGDSDRSRRVEANIKWVRGLSPQYMYAASTDKPWFAYHKHNAAIILKRYWLIAIGHMRATGLKFQLESEKSKSARLLRDLKTKEQAVSVLETAMEQYRKVETEAAEKEAEKTS